MSEELLLAIRMQHSIEEIEALLMEEDLDINYSNESGITALMEAVLNLDTVRLDLLLAQNPKPNLEQEDKNGNTALDHLYMEYVGDNEEDLLPVLYVLLLNGANVNHRCYSEDTCLEWAAYNGHLEIVKLLLKYEAQIGSAIDDARSGMRHASEGASRHQTIITLLEDIQKTAHTNLSSEVDDAPTLGGAFH